MSYHQGYWEPAYTSMQEQHSRSTCWEQPTSWEQVSCPPWEQNSRSGPWEQQPSHSAPWEQQPSHSAPWEQQPSRSIPGNIHLSSHGLRHTSRLNSRVQEHKTLQKLHYTSVLPLLSLQKPRQRLCRQVLLIEMLMSYYQWILSLANTPSFASLLKFLHLVLSSL